MAFVPAGYTTVVTSGARWHGTVRRVEWVNAFCIDRFEESQPSATKDSMGAWDCNEQKPPPPPQSRRGVLPWVSLSWNQARQACHAAGKRLPTLAEWQTAYSGYGGALWPWGADAYQPRRAAGCWTFAPPMTHPTGGCCFEICRPDRCFVTCDMLGNVAEYVDGYWDESCYGKTQILLAGGGIAGWGSPNLQVEDPQRPGCWKVLIPPQTRDALHHHDPDLDRLNDDGFRCVKSPQQ